RDFRSISWFASALIVINKQASQLTKRCPPQSLLNLQQHS
ncbi:MAG: hypothetical protein RLZZ374_2051, partial [Cyanobacteriota bacterium]